MINFIKKYWDIFGGTLSALMLTIIAKFKLEKVQLYYSIIILILVSIGVFRIIKQTLDKQRAKKENQRKHNLIDSIVDGQKSVKAINLAQSPIQEGEKLGNFIIKILEVLKTLMEKLKLFFNKFKGFMLTIALAILTIVEMCGGFINAWFGGALTINGVEIVPAITLVCTAIVGIISNGYSTEQKEKIKALFSKSTSNELVKEEIKKTTKEKTAQKAQFTKMYTIKEHELANLNSELETLNNTYDAKVEMFNMTPQLATNEDVQLAANAVRDCKVKIEEKTKEIAEVKATIDNLTTAINALKSQL